MKLWIDDLRDPYRGYYHIHSVNEARYFIMMVEMAQRTLLGVPREFYTIEVIDIDHDAGDYAEDGGDYIQLLNWLEKTGRNYPIRIHSMNPVGRENMRAIIRRNGWKEVM